jgi:nitrite reductase/ring-hydroxylating ferredoxin subunit
VEEIPTGRTKFLPMGKKPLILANGDGRIYGMFGLCRHENNPRQGATIHDIGQPDRHPFPYDVTTGENYDPKNVYPRDYKRIEAQLRPLPTYAVELRDGEVWVDL